MRYKTRQLKSEIPKVRRVKPAEVRLSELMNAAEQLFLEKGVDATTVNEITELAEVSKGAFYHYFASKNELLEAMAERYTEQFIRRLEESVSACKDEDWIEKLCVWVRVNIEVYAETYQIHDIVYKNHHHHNRNNSDKNAILNQLKMIIDGGNQANLWQVKHPRLTSLMIYVGVHGVTDDIIVSPDTNRDLFIQAVISDCLRMVGVSVS
jgi:AcrR family transcriptional regulator